MKYLSIVSLIVIIALSSLFAQAPDTLWTKTFGDSGHDYGYSVQQTSDGGYIITGSTDSYGAGAGDVWLIKTDSAGNTSWDKTFGGSASELGYSVKQTTEGGYIIVGYTNSYGAGDQDIWLVKTDSLGNKTWDKTFGGANAEVSESVQQTNDGGYIIAGLTQSYGAGSYDVWLIKTDSAGNELWNKTFGDSAADQGRSVQQTNDGGYIIAGFTKSYGAGMSDVWLIKTDSTGNMNWDQTFGGTNADNAYCVQQISNNCYTISGFTESYGAGNEDVWLIKTDTVGNELWNKTLGGTEGERGYSIQQTNNGGYIIVGTTSSYGSGGNDIWLIKTTFEDIIPPVIDSTTIWNDTSYAGPFPVYTKVTDNIEVGSVLLYFKRMEDPSWFSTQMLEGGNNWYYEEIPEAFLVNDTVKYYIFASDTAQPPNETTDPPGAPANYYSFIANMVGIEECQNPKQALKNIRIFPNPFMNILKIEGCSEAKIYDISGRFVAEVENSWDGKNDKEQEAKPGIYFLKAKGLDVRKVIKLK
ncbi:MAG: T9SS type A sorting domain-containing protein [Candidatus Cloacimonadota bacterium]|nr:MAG: T9SS type A sorting domain-containing protein [Candidatus Cloacimonadota bacterium]